MIARTVRGLAALAAVTLTLVGWPVALLQLTGAVSVWLPDLADPVGLLARPDTGGLFLLIVLGIGWAAWAVWVTALLIEAAAQARGIPTPHLGGLFPQHSAAALVTAIAVAFATPGTAAAVATPAPAAVTQTAVSPADSAPTRPAAPAAEQAPAQDAQAHEDYLVERGDTLWQIADEQLDDPTRYPEIAQASQGITQPDGRHLADPDLILPGWTLHVPTAEAGPAAPTRGEPETSSTAQASVPGPDAADPGTPADPVTPPTTPMQSLTPGPGTTAPSAAGSGMPATPLATPTARVDPPTGGGGQGASVVAGPPGPTLPSTPLGGTGKPTAPTGRDAVYDDEGRFAPDHGVLGLPNWITAPLIPTRPEDAPQLIAEAERILAAHGAAAQDGKKATP